MSLYLWPCISKGWSALLRWEPAFYLTHAGRFSESIGKLYLSFYASEVWASQRLSVLEDLQWGLLLYTGSENLRWRNIRDLIKRYYWNLNQAITYSSNILPSTKSDDIGLPWVTGSPLSAHKPLSVRCSCSLLPKVRAWPAKTWLGATQPVLPESKQCANAIQPI